MTKKIAIFLFAILTAYAYPAADTEELIRDLDSDLGRVRQRVEENRDTLVRNEVKIATLEQHDHKDYEARVQALEAQLQQMNGVLSFLNWAIAIFGVVMIPIIIMVITPLLTKRIERNNNAG